jgi:hypothetical protein
MSDKPAKPYDAEILRYTTAVDELLSSTTNPLHRAILHNYRRHQLLEGSGRFAEIFTPDMTVEHPVYNIGMKAGNWQFDGRDAVMEFYGSMTDSDAAVFWPVKKYLVVADWGVAAEATWRNYCKGHHLIADGHDDIHDEDGDYVLTRRMGLFWYYTPDALLIGENTYEDPNSREITKVDPADVVTAAEFAEMVKPLLDNPPPA